MVAKRKIELTIWLCLLGVSTFVFVRVMAERNSNESAADPTILMLSFMCMGASFVFIRQLYSRHR
jgi:hypothetical protein